MARPPKRLARDSRQAILDGAATEFAARGFAGTSVDRIARRAEVNKAMIYYHFRSKEALYRVILRSVFLSLGQRARAIAASDLPPPEQVDALVEAIMREGEARPHFPPMMLREIAEGGRCLDARTFRAMAAVFLAAREVIDRGVQTGAFVAVDPMLTYFTMLGPVMFYLGTSSLRAAIGRSRAGVDPRTDPATFVAHLQAMLRRALCAPASARAARPLARRRTTRAGDRP
jgi:AcrR family transcriptional regulator